MLFSMGFILKRQTGLTAKFVHMKNSYKRRQQLCKRKQSARNRTTKMLQVYAGSVKDLISQKYK